MKVAKLKMNTEVHKWWWEACLPKAALKSERSVDRPCTTLCNVSCNCRFSPEVVRDRAAGCREEGRQEEGRREESERE
jgi:hypothetical protein